MQIELADVLQWGWGVLLPLMFVHWKDNAKDLARRAQLIHDHETRIAVLESGQATFSKTFESIDRKLTRIEEMLHAKADK